MGQKIHPVGFRLPVTRDWSSCWFATSKDFARMLQEDLKVRAYLMKRLSHAAVARIVIERPAKSAKVTVYCARPGVAIGKKGEDHDSIKAHVFAILKVPVHISIEEVRKPELNAQLVADSIAQQLERRIMFRRAMKRAIQNAMRLGAIGIKIASSGRLNGIEIARCEWYREGRVPLQTIRADVSYALSEAKTTYGIIGVKVWIYKGDFVANDAASAAVVATPETDPRKGKKDDQKLFSRYRSSKGDTETRSDSDPAKKLSRRVKKVGR